jgi:ankyrin repeat protein
MDSTAQGRKSGGRAVALLLVKKIAHVDAKDQYGRTAIYGCKEMALLLLEKLANINVEDELGQTALHWAARSGNEPVLHLLIENGADIDAKDDRGHELIVQQLLDKGADVNMKTELGQTALHGAARYGQGVVILLLLGYNADINARDNFGQTALHKVNVYQSEALAWLLLWKGADINAPTASALRGLAANNGNQAEAMNQRALRSVSNMALLLADQGKNKAAEALGRQIREHSERIWRPQVDQLDCPSTLFILVILFLIEFEYVYLKSSLPCLSRFWTLPSLSAAGICLKVAPWSWLQTS